MYPFLHCVRTMYTTGRYLPGWRRNKYEWLDYTVAETNWARASVVYCPPIIGCQGVLLWACQALSSRPNWLVCSCPPKGPELNLLVMASISWLDKIPPNHPPRPSPFLLCSLSQHPFLAQELSFNFITQQGEVHALSQFLSFTPHFVHVNLIKFQEGKVFRLWLF